MVRAAVIAVSDWGRAPRRARGFAPLAQSVLVSHGLEVVHQTVVPTQIEAIRSAIGAAVDAGARFVLTVGATGVGPRDVTPEATRPLLAAQIPGIAQALRSQGRERRDALLSRGLVGVTRRVPGAALVVNAQGSEPGVRDAVAVVAPLLGAILADLDGRPAT